MNKREAAIVTAYTGILIGSFSDFHEYAEEVMDSPIWTHQFGDREFAKKLKAASKADFVKLHESLVEDQDK